VKVLCAPDKFRGTIDASSAAAAMARGAHAAGAAAVECPIADGGEGSLETILHAGGGQVRRSTVIGPLGEPVAARWGWIASDRTAVIEMAQASGLALVPPERRDPLRATSYGTGQLLREAIESGARRVIVCVGGSATIDGGAGALQALGCRFFDQDSRQMSHPIGGGEVGRIARVDPAGAVGGRVPVVVACDVTNPLLGPTGAARVFGPQKGATEGCIKALERGLGRFAEVIGGDAFAPFTGAAGGITFGLARLAGATLRGGAEMILEAVRFDGHLTGAALVLTGEGSLDAQSLRGKAVMAAARAAGERGVPTIAIVGRTGEGWRNAIGAPAAGGLLDVFDLTREYGDDAARHDTAVCIERATESIVRRFTIGPKQGSENQA
jgi:glycerate kinase